MKKLIMVLFLATVAFGLTACGGATENQDTQSQTTVSEQEAREVSDGNIDTNTNPNTNEQVLPQEQLVGTIHAIDGMNITINTMQAMVFNEPGEGRHFVSPGNAENEPQESQEISIHLTEQTTIKVNEIRAIAGGGQMSDTRAGTLDDLTLQAFVMAEGDWQDDKFVATTVTIIGR